MTSRAFQLLLFIAAIGFWSTEAAPARAEGGTRRHWPLL